MTKVLKSGKTILLIIVSLIVVCIGFATIFLVRRNAERSKFKPVDTQEVLADIYSISTDFVNSYIVRCSDKFIAIDAGIDEKTAKAELEKLNINPNDVAGVFLTHTDNDHIAALNLFENAKIYISEAEEQMIDGTTVRTLIVKNKLDYPYITLKDNEEIELNGCKVQGILTPGHTKGSMSYLVNGRYLFTGDTLSLNNNQAQLFNSFFNMDDKEEETSIMKLSKLNNIDYIFTAHYGFTSYGKTIFQNW